MLLYLLWNGTDNRMFEVVIKLTNGPAERVWAKVDQESKCRAIPSYHSFKTKVRANWMIFSKAKTSAACLSDFSEYSPITLALPSMRKPLFHVTDRLIGWGSRAVELNWITQRNGTDSTMFEMVIKLTNQWRSQDLEVGAQGVWGTEVPQRGPGAEPLVGGSGGHSLSRAHSSY